VATLSPAPALPQALAPWRRPKPAQTPLPHRERRRALAHWLRPKQAPKKGWSKTQKGLLIAAIAVGVAALLFVAIKYGKECLRTDPEDCALGVDEPCTCVEYKRRIPEGQ